ncbi:MAG: flagellum-specific ATP synthase FliI, partial [Thioalkalispiraceae bacterium]
MNNPLPETRRSALWQQRLQQQQSRLDDVQSIVVEGRLNRMVGLTLEAVGCQAAIGARCLLENQQGEPVEAEVVGFSGESLFLMPTGNIRGIRPGSPVIPTQGMYEASIGDEVLGR